MKYNWIWCLLIGLLLGTGLGTLLQARFNRASPPKGTALFRDFSVPAIAAKVGQTNWQVIEDRIYEPFPTFARAKRIARRIVLRTDMREGELSAFATQFQQTTSKYLTSYGARNVAQFDVVQDSTKPIDGVPVRSRLDLPRRYYTIGDVHGVADVWYVAESGHVTVIASLIEGP